jgi:hypothetical protein
MKPVKQIVLTFGGSRRLADILGHENVTTIQGWIKRDNIPSRQIPLVYRASRRLGLGLRLSDFLQIDEA